MQKKYQIVKGKNRTKTTTKSTNMKKNDEKHKKLASL